MDDRLAVDERQRVLAVALLDQLQASGELLEELGRPQQAGVLAKTQHPRDEHSRGPIGGEEDTIARSLLLGSADLSVAAEVALDLPRDPLAEQDLRGPPLLPQLPLRAVGVRARVEVGGAPEVVLRLRRVGHFAADAREAEDTDRLALVGAAQQIELPALEQQVVGVHAPGAHLVALHRVVVERDRLLAEDRRLDLRQARGELVAAGRGRDPECHGALLLGRSQRTGPPPGDLLQREPQRLRVGELPVQQVQGSLQCGELLVCELDLGQMEALRAQRVTLLLGRRVRGRSTVSWIPSDSSSARSA